MYNISTAALTPGKGEPSSTKSATTEIDNMDKARLQSEYQNPPVQEACFEPMQNLDRMIEMEGKGTCMGNNDITSQVPVARCTNSVKVTKKTHWLVSKAVSMIKGVDGVIHICIRYLVNAIKYTIVHPASQIIMRITLKHQYNSKVQGLCMKVLTMVHWLLKTKDNQPEGATDTDQCHLSSLYGESQITRETLVIRYWKRPSYVCATNAATRCPNQVPELGNFHGCIQNPTIVTQDDHASSLVSNTQEGFLHWMTHKLGPVVDEIATSAGWHMSIQEQGRCGNQEVFSGNQEGFFHTVLTMDITGEVSWHQKMEMKCQETGEV